MSTRYLKFNVNDYVYAKLLDGGFKQLVAHYSKYVPNLRGYDYMKDEAYYRSRVDEEGYYRFQLHEFMEIFGSVWSHKYPSLFEMDVRFESSDMTPVEDDLVTVERLYEGSV